MHLMGYPAERIITSDEVSEIKKKVTILWQLCKIIKQLRIVAFIVIQISKKIMHLNLENSYTNLVR